MYIQKKRKRCHNVGRALDARVSLFRESAEGLADTRRGKAGYKDGATMGGSIQ